MHVIFCRVRFFYSDILNWLWMLELCLRLVPLRSHLQHFLGCVFSPFWTDGQRHFIMEWDLTVPKMGLLTSRKLPKFLLPLFYKLNLAVEYTKLILKLFILLCGSLLFNLYLAFEKTKSILSSLVIHCCPFYCARHLSFRFSDKKACCFKKPLPANYLWAFSPIKNW